MNELVAALRHCAKRSVCNGCPRCGKHITNCPTELYREAADAIEELSKRVDRAVELYNRDDERSAMYEALAGIAPEPPKEEERSFCADCAWYEPERQHCWFRKSDAENCVLWEPKMETPKEEA